MSSLSASITNVLGDIHVELVRTANPKQHTVRAMMAKIEDLPPQASLEEMALVQTVKRSKTAWAYKLVKEIGTTGTAEYLMALRMRVC